MITIENLREGDDEAAMKLGQQAFSGTQAYDPDRPRLPEGRVLCGYDGDELVAQVRRHEFQHAFGGKLVACGGISGVAVAPQARSQGLARKLLLEQLDRGIADGEPIASLYPTTAALYRSVGFEVAAMWTNRAIPIGELPRPDGSITWKRAGLEDLDGWPVYDRMALDNDCWVLPDIGWRTYVGLRAKRDTTVNRYLYQGHRDGELVAEVTYSYGKSDRAMYSIDAEATFALDGHALREALAFLGANGTTADEVSTTLPANLLGLHLPHLQRTRIKEDWPFMLAILDLPNAVAARGYPEGVTGTVALSVTDPLRTANAGNWVLSVADGAATVEPGGDGHVAVTITDLAALYTGWLDPLTLARAGRLGHPTDTDLGLLRATFAATPSITIFF